MICPICKNKLNVTNCVSTNIAVFRLRECPTCKEKFYSKETIVVNQEKVKAELNQIKNNKYKRNHAEYYKKQKMKIFTDYKKEIANV